MPTPDVVVSTQTFSFTRGDGAAVTIHKDETFSKDSERLASVPRGARAEHFVPFVAQGAVEQATAAPGEKRRGRRKTTKHSDEGSGQATAAPEPEPIEPVAETPEPEQSEDTGGEQTPEPEAPESGTTEKTE